MNPVSTKTNTAARAAKPETGSASNASCWVEVSRGALARNLSAIQAHVGPNVIVCPVIKSDAYGHGAAGCALALRDAGAKWLAVSTVDEGATLRRLGIQTRILVLSGFWRGEEDVIVRHQLTPAIWELAHVQLLAKAAQKVPPGQPIAVHLKVNTGMNRLGAEIKDLPQIYDALQTSPEVLCEGLFSHFAASETIDDAHGAEQLRQFQSVIAQAKGRGFTPSICHMANSAAIAGRPASWFSLVRPGLAVLGHCLPLTSERDPQSPLPNALPLQPALAWKTRVVQLRDVAAGQQVGYSGAFVAKSTTRVAVLAVGYGDGLSRKLSSRGRVIVRDAYAPIVGNISMNLTAVDVTQIPGVNVDDEVTIVGSSASCSISPWEHAGLASTIAYEILCNIAGRLPRLYVE